MSVKFSLNKDKFIIEKLKLPSRYYYFNDEENYVKLLSIGEGIFPKDKIRTKMTLTDSTCIVTTESATKVYPSKKEFGINSVDISLKNSNLEFLNDELILYKASKIIQLLNIKADDKSTFFYVDILTDGRSYENFDFSKMLTRNKFYINGELEYLENYELSGNQIKEYIKRHDTSKSIFAKIYIKIADNEHLLDILSKNSFDTFSYTRNKQMFIGLVSDINMFVLKTTVNKIWTIYRKSLNKEKFNLGKQ